jgi:hypothetical protein
MTKHYAPATERNRNPILAVLQTHLPEQGTVLEVSSGTGQHAAFFAPRLTPRWWLPTDIGETNLSSIAAWCQEANAPNLLAPQYLDVLDTRWPVEESELPAPINAVVNINMVHISPWPCCEALFDGAARIVKSPAPVLIYGPFKRGGKHTALSNAAFDQQLRAQDMRWGVRDLEVVIEAAESRGFHCQTVVPMPANNLMVVFTRA